MQLEAQNIARIIEDEPDFEGDPNSGAFVERSSRSVYRLSVDDPDLPGDTTYTSRAEAIQAATKLAAEHGWEYVIFSEERTTVIQETITIDVAGFLNGTR